LSDSNCEPLQEDFQNNFALIPPQIWNGTLTECGLVEGCVLFFTNRKTS